jgi:hypothetical protein
MNFKVGDSILVKHGVKDPDLSTDIGGWQGRISEVQEDNIVCINWDSITLKEMPTSAIKKCEQEGWGWDRMYLDTSDIELTDPRDTNKEVKSIISKLQYEYAWIHLGEEGERIQSVLSGIASDDYWNAFKAWRKYLKEKLSFPFKAIVDEVQERGPMKAGNEVTVHRISEIEEMYGILVDIEYKRKNYIFPLADLDVIEKSSNNYLPIKDYVIWFANR